jgi:hypothetical protein
MSNNDKCSPGSHPHADRPNWQPADTIDGYLENCTEGLEQYSDRRAAKLLDISRAELWRWKLMSQLPAGLFDYIAQEARRANVEISSKSLAQIALALRRDGNSISEVEHCPHCGGVIRIRQLVGNKLTEIVNRWLASQ